MFVFSVTSNSTPFNNILLSKLSTFVIKKLIFALNFLEYFSFIVILLVTESIFTSIPSSLKSEFNSNSPVSEFLTIKNGKYGLKKKARGFNRWFLQTIQPFSPPTKITK